MKIKTYPLTILLLLTAHLSISQIDFTGKITDVTGEVLEGALISSSSDTTISDTHGHFHIRATHFPLELNIYFLGYKPLSVMVKSSADQTFALTPSSLQLSEVVVSESGSKSSLDISASIQSVTPDMLSRDASFQLVNSLNRLPGVYMQSGALNTSRIVIRGIGSRSLYGTDKIKMYLDQIPLTDGSGSSALEDIDKSVIGKMEVIKGPNSSLYGAGLGGAIRLLSRQTAGQSFAETSLTLGSFGQKRWNITSGLHLHKSNLLASYNNLESDGFRQNSHYQRNQFFLNNQTKISTDDKLSFVALYTDMKAYIPSSTGKTDFENNPEKAATTWNAARGYEAYQKLLLGVTNEKNWTDGKLSNTLFLKAKTADEPRPFNILQENSIAAGTRNLLWWQKNNLSLKAGWELYAEKYDWKTFQNLYTSQTNGSVKGSMLSDNEEFRTYTNLFTEADWQISDHWSMQAGLNYNKTWYVYNDQYEADSTDYSGNYAFHNVWSPKAGMIYHPGKRSAIFLNVSHGFSPPSLEETLTPDGQINPHIKPESGWNFEAGTKGNWQHLDYSVTAYFMQIQHLLVSERVGDDQYVGVNAGVNHHLGLEVSGNYFIQLPANYQLNLFSNGAYMDYKFASFVNEDISYAGKQLTGAPKWTMTSGLELLSEHGFYAHLNLQYTGRFPITDDNTLYTDDYLILRAKAGYRLSLINWDFDLHFGADNLTDAHYASMILINATATGANEPRYYYPGMPRNYFGGLSIRYRFATKEHKKGDQ